MPFHTSEVFHAAIIRAAMNDDITELDHLLAASDIDIIARNHAAIIGAAKSGVAVAATVLSASAVRQWRMVEILLGDPVLLTIQNHGITLLAPIMRHLQAIQLCKWTHPNRDEDDCPVFETHGLNVPFYEQILFGDAFREAYKLAYGVVRAEEMEGELPVGVSELVCAYGVESRGLAEWTMHVQRQLRTHLNKLRQCAPSFKQSRPHTDLQEKKQKNDRDITSIGSVVRHVPVFGPTNTWYQCVAVAGGRLYLSNYHHYVVDVVDAASGRRETRYGTFNQAGKAVVGQPPRFECPWGVAVGETRGRVYVVDQFNHCVVVVRLCDGMVEAVWGRKGSGQQQFNQPRGLAYCPATDLLYVADCLNHCVKVLRGSDGQCVQVLGKGHGNGSNQMNCPQGVAVDLGHIYITEVFNHRVVVYAKQTGTCLFQMGQGKGSGDAQFNCPYSVSVDSEAGVVYVADYGNRRVCVYRSGDGSYVRHFQVLQANNTKLMPECVMWDAVAGVLYVTIYDSTTLCVYPC